MELEARMRNWDRYQRGMDFGNSYWENTMNKYECEVCGNVHDEAVDGKWDELPQFYLCPECGCHKDEYFLVE
jgi:rubredoxin